MQRALRAVRPARTFLKSENRDDTKLYPHSLSLTRFSSPLLAQLQSSGHRSWRGQWFVCLAATLLPLSPLVML